jgi:alpha-glucosidase
LRDRLQRLAAFARRKGDRWFLAIVNGPTARTLRIPPTFLKAGAHPALLVRDDPANPASVKVETTTVARDTELAIDLRAGGGFIARFDGP